jgi:hypothetical protein
MTLVSCDINPLIVLLELIWTRLSYIYPLSTWFEDDIDIDPMHGLLLARAVSQGGVQGWAYEGCELSKGHLAENKVTGRWAPAKLTLEQFIIVNRLCLSDPIEISDPEFCALLRDNNIDLEHNLPILTEARLVAMRDGQLFLLTRSCSCAITPSGEYVAGENSGGQLNAWLSREIEKARAKQRNHVLNHEE